MNPDSIIRLPKISARIVMENGQGWAIGTNPKPEIRNPKEIRNPRSERNPNSEIRRIRSRSIPAVEIREAIAKLLFSHDFAINDFAFISWEWGKQRDGKLIDGKIMMSFAIAPRNSYFDAVGGLADSDLVRSNVPPILPECCPTSNR